VELAVVLVKYVPRVVARSVPFRVMLGVVNPLVAFTLPFAPAIVKHANWESQPIAKTRWPPL
jgi:hypothetical protein